MYEILPDNSCFIVFWICSFKVSPLNSDKLLFYAVVDAIITYKRSSLEVSLVLLNNEKNKLLILFKIFNELKIRLETIQRLSLRATYAK